MSWELPAITALVLSVVVFWWLLNPRSHYQRGFYAVVCLLPLLVDPRRIFDHLYTTAYDTLFDFRSDVLLTQRLNMALTLGAVVWLLNRSWQTLWKPVPDLINILGVDVPEPPDVSLAGIRSDAATLSWTRPSSNRPVQKYSIQVNGVHVGDSPGNETAITVTGLKPNHFYNIRVVAVGPNSFQAGSPVIRLRTFGKDGKPHLGNSRLPVSFAEHEHLRPRGGNESDDSDAPRYLIASVEAAASLDGNAAARDNSTTPGQRRNTVNRRHSPSVASMDQPQLKNQPTGGPELTLDELNRKFESIRKDIDDTLSQYAKDEADYQHQDDDLKKEKEVKKQALKEKEEQTTQLKAMVRTTMEQMRAVEKERAKKEQQLKDKVNKKAKVRDNTTKLEQEIERMKKERERFSSQKLELEDKRDDDVEELDTSNAELQEGCAELEAELKEKGKQLQDLKESREQLPGADDEQWLESDAVLKREWEEKRKELHQQLVSETKRMHQLDQHIRVLGEQLTIQHQSGLAFYNQVNNSSVAEVEQQQQQQQPPASSTNTNQAKRLSLTSPAFSNALLSPPNQFSLADHDGQTSNNINRSSFPSSLFMDMPPDASDEPQTEAEMRAASGPLSPSAKDLLPSGIFDEMEAPDLKEEPTPLLPESVTAAEDPQSPASSSRSYSVFSSPHGSTQNLPFPQYADSSERMSLNLNQSPAAPPATGLRLTSLLQTFQRNRGAKTIEEGPAIGSLKPGQSQSFPRNTDDPDSNLNKRRISFSFMRNSSGPDAGPGTAAPLARGFSTRRLLPFGGHGSLAEKDHNGSRPASVASTELPRPSTDSGSIWGTTGADVAAMSKSRIWSPSDPRWGSRNGSRRPSLHGSPSALTTTLASADDDILDPLDMNDPQTSPSQVGVIGSRPPGAAMSKLKGLNPNAPTFMGNIFRKDRDKEKDTGSEKDKSKGKDKAKEKNKEGKGKGKNKEATTPSIELPPPLDESPSDSRMSRDTFSGDTHTSVSVSESHESLALDTSLSNTPSDAYPASSSVKDQESAVRKLFRKGSSSKFSLSSRLGKDSGLFKKGPGSATNSDKNMSADHRSSIGDVDDLGSGLTMEDAAAMGGAMHLGRSYDSIGSSPSLGPSKTKDSKDSGRMSAWRFSMKKKGKETPAKEKESLEMDRPTATTDDE